MSGVNISMKIPPIGISGTLEPYLNAAVQGAITTSLLVIRDKWQQEAQRKLNSTRSDYLLGLSFESVKYPYQDNLYSGAVELQGKVANSIEKGWDAFDMKEGFANSGKKIMKANGKGWYLTIPIRHSTPNSFMYGKPMPTDIYAEAKKLPHWGSITVKGGQLTSWTGYTHKSNIHDKLTRIQKQYPGGRKQSQYFTFRRVSDKSDPNSWWHPGFSGVHIAESLEGFARVTFKRSLEANLAHVLGGK